VRLTHLIIGEESKTFIKENINNQCQNEKKNKLMKKKSFEIEKIL